MDPERSRIQSQSSELTDGKWKSRFRLLLKRSLNHTNPNLAHLQAKYSLDHN